MVQIVRFAHWDRVPRPLNLNVRRKSKNRDMEVMRSNNNCLCYSESARRRRESKPENLRQETQIRIAATGSSAHVIRHRWALLPEGRCAYAPSHTSNSESYHRSVAGRASSSLTRGSNRSLRSLGRAKARPLTKRYTELRIAENSRC